MIDLSRQLHLPLDLHLLLHNELLRAVRDAGLLAVSLEGVDVAHELVVVLGDEAQHVLPRHLLDVVLAEPLQALGVVRRLLDSEGHVVDDAMRGLGAGESLQAPLAGDLLLLLLDDEGEALDVLLGQLDLDAALLAELSDEKLFSRLALGLAAAPVVLHELDDALESAARDSEGEHLAHVAHEVADDGGAAVALGLEVGIPVLDPRPHDDARRLALPVHGALIHADIHRDKMRSRPSTESLLQGLDWSQIAEVVGVAVGRFIMIIILKIFLIIGAIVIIALRACD